MKVIINEGKKIKYKMTRKKTNVFVQF